MITVTIIILLVLLALTIPVAVALGCLGLILDQIYSFLPLFLAIGQTTWSTLNEFVLVSIPFFILLGEIFLRSGIAEKMYGAASQWLSWLPGGLMHSNVGASAMFAAVSGSSVATAATIGTVAIDQIEERGYNEKLFLGTITAGGTLGVLIPPSIPMIVFGALTDTSIPQLYLAGFVPGIILSLMFMLTVLIACIVSPRLDGDQQKTNWKSRFRSLKDLVPPLIIFIIVIGTIYAGIATPTESAALGVIAAFILAALKRRLNWTMLKAAIEGTMRSTAMVMAILIAAYFLNFIFTAIGLTSTLNNIVTQLGWSPMQTMLAIVCFYLIMGLFLETLSMVVATAPIITPVVVNLGFDPVWFGVLMMLLVETAMITPPVGINLFTVQGVRKGGAISDVMIGSIPFAFTLLGMIALLLVFPKIALWLPQVFN